MDKTAKRQAQVDRARSAFKAWMSEEGIPLKTNTKLEALSAELARIVEEAAIKQAQEDLIYKQEKKAAAEAAKAAARLS